MGAVLCGALAGLLARAGPEQTESPRLTWVFSPPAGVKFTRSEVTVAQYRADGLPPEYGIS